VLIMPYERAIAGSSGGNSADICSPMKMFDYLACGRVILSSDLAVIHEVLNPQNAVFCQPGDAASWVEALRDISTHPEKRAELSAHALEDSANYSWVNRARKALEGFQ
jgi:glycosyltransferase involved in cell wall biosynthesis